MQAFLIEKYNGGFDYTFECVGRVETMRQALEAAHKGWGESCILGVAAAGKEISTRPFQLVTGRTWKGSAFGGWKSVDSVPKLVEEYQKGKIALDKFITGHYDLSQINEAFESLHSGQGLFMENITLGYGNGDCLFARLFINTFEHRQSLDLSLTV
ncbi:unnamed protein product, partial [Gongylonema pulchrum]